MDRESLNCMKELNESLESINETIDNMIDTLQKAKVINESTIEMINIASKQK